MTLPNEIREVKRGMHDLETRIANLERSSLELRKVYVAASYPRKHDALVVATAIQEHGFRVVSTWFEDTSADDIYREEDSAAFDKAAWDQACNAAESDYQQMLDCNMLVVITGDKQTRGG